VEVRQVADAVREVALAPLDGRPLESFSAGAHVECEVRLPDGRAATRAYSLINAPDNVSAYQIAVALADPGRGGSAFVYQLEVGVTVRVSTPRNDFPLAMSASESLLIAGGIGITPILAMARALARGGRPFELHYAGRQRSAMAFADEVEAIPSATLVCDGGDPARGLQLATILAMPRLGRHLYVCGPRPLIEATLAAAKGAGWSPATLHFELFGADGPKRGDKPFTVEFVRSGKSAEVGVGRTILDVMEELGLNPIFDCRRGECGVCVADIIEGQPDHRDMNLSNREKQAGKLICTCVSRATSERLVLDI
jgi:vanillate O-demethylase ferredoxin subunit